MKRSFKYLVGLAVLFFLSMDFAYSSQYTIYTEEIPPWNYTKSQKLIGFSVEIVREMSGNMQLSPVSSLRALKRSDVRLSTQRNGAPFPS